MLQQLMNGIWQHAGKIVLSGALVVGVELAIVAAKTPMLPEAGGKKQGCCKDGKLSPRAKSARDDGL